MFAQIDPEAGAGEMIEAYYVDGFDTVFLMTEELDEEVVERHSVPIDNLRINKMLPDQSVYNFMPPASDYIVLLPESITKAINKNLYGINLTGTLSESKLPYEPEATYSPTSELQWEWISELKPSVVRFPGGSFSKFMHLLTDVDTGLKSQGYGYNLPELIRYFDWTDGVMNDPLVSDIADDDPTDPLVIASWTWIHADHRNLFSNFLEEWQHQELLAPGTNYLDDFIRMIEKIETENDFYKVDVVVCLNIVSETAADCRNIIDYLRTDNTIWDVNVIGVELGNECYSKFFCDALGFTAFDDSAADGLGNYWDFVNGTDYVDPSAQAGLETVLSAEMEAIDGHNYIKLLKEDAGFECLVGIPGAPISTAALKPLIMASCIDALDWNDQIQDHYCDEIAVLGGGTRAKFDAVILHLYYDDSEWGNIPQSNLNEDVYTDGIWEYDVYDERLRDAFEGILGISGPPGNFKSLLKTEYKNSFDDYSSYLYFNTPTGECGKDLWVTEYNMKNGESGPGLDLRLLVFQNGFAQGYLLFEWFLRNIKVNYSTDFRERFFTIATLQSVAGPNYDMFSPARLPDELIASAAFYEAEYPDIDEPPYATGDKYFYKKHIAYFVMELAGDIFKRNLELVKMNGVMQTTNPNLFPTIFIDNVTNDLYIFYSNIREVDQCYRLNLEGMTDLFPGCDIFFGTAEIMAVDALQHYSSTGYSSLFEINAAYEPLTEPYPVEITELAPFTNNTDCPPGVPISQRFTVPAISFGYIKIPLLLTCKLGEPELDENKQIAIYPNPASSIINFLLTDQSVLNTKSIYELKIYASDGRELFATIHQIDKPLDVSYLTAGTYFIKLKSADFSSTIPFTICK